MPEEKIKALKALALKVDVQEAGSIKQRAKIAFREHERLLAIVQKLKLEREQMGVSLGELSIRTGIAKSNLSRLENKSDISPTLETLSRYANAVGKSIDIKIVSAKRR